MGLIKKIVLYSMNLSYILPFCKLFTACNTVDVKKACWVQQHCLKVVHWDHCRHHHRQPLANSYSITTGVVEPLKTYPRPLQTVAIVVIFVARIATILYGLDYRSHCHRIHIRYRHRHLSCHHHHHYHLQHLHHRWKLLRKIPHCIRTLLHISVVASIALANVPVAVVRAVIPPAVRGAAARAPLLHLKFAPALKVIQSCNLQYEMHSPSCFHLLPSFLIFSSSRSLWVLSVYRKCGKDLKLENCIEESHK